MSGLSHRVALVTRSVPFGGTTTFMLFLCSGLRKLGIPVEVFSFTAEHPLHEEFSQLDLSVHLLDEQRLILEDRLASVYDKLRQFKPSAVFSVLGSESFEVLRYLPPGVLRVGMLHDHTAGVYELIRNYREWIDQVAVVSQPIADHVAAQFPGVPCAYLQHGVMFYDENVQRAQNPNDPLKILFFGRLQQSQKQVRMFPDIYAALKRRAFPFRWTIHGEGPERNYLIEHFREALDCGDVRFSEPVRHDQLPRLVAAHDVYLLTSAHEGGPLSLIEGMGRGLVPICGDIPCLVQEMITSENGFRVPREDPNAYADAIEQLHRDRARLERMSHTAREVAMSSYSDVAMARRYVRFVEQHTASAPATWPPRIRLQPMVGGGVKFHAALRPLRRLRKSLKARKP